MIDRPSSYDAGADGVVFTRGSVDPRNAKAVRSTTGSLFHLPVVTDVDFDEVDVGAEAGLLRRLTRDERECRNQQSRRKQSGHQGTPNL